MANISYTSRRELEEHSFHPAVTLLVPVVAILVQVLLPKPFPRLAILDLPLIVTIFFAVSRRSPIAGTFTGAIIGLLQDALTNQPIGVLMREYGHDPTTAGTHAAAFISGMTAAGVDTYLLSV